MYKSSLGYVFECRKDVLGGIGIKESFSYIQKDGVQKVNAIFSIDINGNILCPTYLDKALGFTSVKSLVNPETFDDDVKKFIRSNRAVYSLRATTYLICSLNGKISKETHDWVDDSVKLNFYVPKGSVALAKLVNASSKEDWGIVCDIAAPSGKLNTFHVSEGILNGYSKLVLDQLKDIVVGDKQSYISGRLSKYM